MQTQEFTTVRAAGRSPLRAWPVLIPFLLYLAHAWLYRHWLIDDAGISFAYARNLAFGHGLVSQPGVPPVEGYSNPLWVFLLTPFFRLHLFHPYLVPKLLSALLVLWAYCSTHRLLRAQGPMGDGMTLVALSLLSLSTPFAVWTTSGLENALTAALAASFAWQLWSAAQVRAGLRHGLLLGLTTAALALTRPDGLIYAAAWPILLTTRARGDRRSLVPCLLGCAAAFLLVAGGHELFRWHYFGDWVPNTYYAKGAAYFGLPLRMMGLILPVWDRVLDLCWGVGGYLGELGLLWLTIATLVLMDSRKLSFGHTVLLTLLGLSGLAYLLLPGDWMGEYRFATTFGLFFWSYAALVTAQVLALVPWPRTRVVVAAVALLAAALTFAPRARAFAANPIVPFDDVAARMAYRVNRYADLLGQSHASFLTPELGGTLYASHLRVYDLGMLCDKTIARTMGRDQRAFYNYVFEDTKPTFIHVHGVFFGLARLNNDPRLARDYVPLWKWEQCPDGTWAEYVRKEAVRGHEAGLARIRAQGPPDH